MPTRLALLAVAACATGSHAGPPPYWLELPVTSTLHLTITSNAYEDVPNSRTLLRPLTFQAWDLPAAKAYLHGVLAPKPAPTPAGTVRGRARSRSRASRSLPVRDGGWLATSPHIAFGVRFA